MKKAKNFKIAVTVMSLLACAALLTSCGGHIKDKNGPDDFSLVKLTNEEILGTSVSATVTNTAGTVDEGDGVTSYSDSCISGVKTIAEYNTADQEITDKGILKVTVDSEVREGNAKILFFEKNAPGNFQEIEFGDGKTVEVSDPHGRYLVRVGAESADIDIKVKFEFIPIAQ